MRTCDCRTRDGSLTAGQQEGGLFVRVQPSACLRVLGGDADSLPVCLPVSRRSPSWLLGPAALTTFLLPPSHVRQCSSGLLLKMAPQSPAASPQL